MNSKRILIIKLTPYDVLGSSTLRLLALIKGLLLEGYQIDWLTLPSSSLVATYNTEKYHFLSEVNLVFAQNTNSVYNSIVTNKSNNQSWLSGLRSIYHYLTVFDHTKEIAKHISIDLLPTTEYRYIISVSDPKTSHIAAKVLINQGLHYDKWIEYWGDPLVHDITEPSIYPTWILKLFERNLMNRCDRIVYTSPFTLKDEKKIHPGQADKMIMTPTAFIDEKLYESTRNDKFIVGYYGAYYSKVRNILPLNQACIALSNQVELVVFGESDKPLDGSKNVFVHPRGEIGEYEEKTDLLVCILNSSGTQIPGKLYHYAATNKPVLVILDGDNRKEMIKFLTHFNRYIMCNNTEADISTAIQHIISSKVEYLPCEEMHPRAVAARIIRF